MVFTLILFLLIVVFMAFFVGKNLSNVCTLWLFKTFENIPASVLVLFSFAAGIVFCILFIIIYKLKKTFSDDTAESSDSKNIQNELKKSERQNVKNREKLERKMKKFQKKSSEKSKKNNSEGKEKSGELEKSGVSGFFSKKTDADDEKTEMKLSSHNALSAKDDDKNEKR